MPSSQKPAKTAQQPKPVLFEHNALVCLDSGVWVKAADEQRDFINYTDGEASESAVYNAVLSAQDRSVDSDELDAGWADWAMEYHLSSKRANLYRALNLSGVKRVLEIGCGCGAITRYFGEQGFQVDAIEGTLRRAQIARLRTEDLPNVQVISSNYHQLLIPDHCYDLIVFTGVLEYSGAYAQDGLSPEAQLQQTLTSVQSALTTDGAILIAIENRTGFKYIAGAGEDHLNVPYAGLINYLEPASGALTRGIRTWTKSEWTAMIAELNHIRDHAFCYPFPDYKVPQALLSDHFIQQSKHAAEVLSGIHSRDYLRTWQAGVDESLFWKAANETGSMGEFANSFLIVLAKQNERVAQIIDFDFVRFTNTLRKAHHRFMVRKPIDSPMVERTPLSASSAQGADEPGPVTNTGLPQEPYIDGRVLLNQWLDQLKVSAYYEELAALIRAYYAWLEQGLKLSESPRTWVDALPQNIIVDDEQAWHLIDREWQSPSALSAEHIFFRAMLHTGLAVRAHVYLLNLNQGRHPQGCTTALLPPGAIDNLQDFIYWCFAAVNIDLKAEDYARYVDWEAAMQSQLVKPKYSDNLRKTMAQFIPFSAAGSKLIDLRPTEVLVFWTQVDGVWSSDHCTTGQFKEEDDLSAVLTLPAMIASHPYLKIGFAHDRFVHSNGWADFASLLLEETDANGARRSVLEINSVDALLQKTIHLENISLSDSGLLLFTGQNPALTLHYGQLDWAQNITGVTLTLSLRAPLVQDYLSAHKALVIEGDQAAARLRHHQSVLELQTQRITQASKTLATLEQKIARLKRSHTPRLWEKLKKRWV